MRLTSHLGVALDQGRRVGPQRPVPVGFSQKTLAGASEQKHPNRLVLTYLTQQVE